MFSTKDHIEKKEEKSGRGRLEYLQSLITEFQDTDKNENKKQVLANLANFSYDPYNYGYLRQLNTVDLFLDMLTEDDDDLVEYGLAGICNLCLDKLNKKTIVENDGVDAVINCLSSTREETVLNAITTLMFLMCPESKQAITSDEVADCMQRLSTSSNPRLKNLAIVFIEDYLPKYNSSNYQ